MNAPSAPLFCSSPAIIAPLERHVAACYCSIEREKLEPRAPKQSVQILSFVQFAMALSNDVRKAVQRQVRLLLSAHWCWSPQVLTRCRQTPADLQVEFYFSDSNLPRDKFLREKIDEEPEVLSLIKGGSLRNIVFFKNYSDVVEHSLRRAMSPFLSCAPSNV